jgi:hypothetical protein
MIIADKIGIAIVLMFSVYLLVALSVLLRGSIKKYCHYRERIKEARKNL